VATADLRNLIVGRAVPAGKTKRAQVQAKKSLKKYAEKRDFGRTPEPVLSVARAGGIGKDGNRRVRAAMVELAWLWLRWQPDSTLSA
jgi:hypothetical protein